MANNLPFEKQVAVISSFVEGGSVRGTERMTGVHRDTCLRLMCERCNTKRKGIIYLPDLAT